jgi:hypothetical protein
MREGEWSTSPVTACPPVLPLGVSGCSDDETLRRSNVQWLASVMHGLLFCCVYEYPLYATTLPASLSARRRTSVDVRGRLEFIFATQILQPFKRSIHN